MKLAVVKSWLILMLHQLDLPSGTENAELGKTQILHASRWHELYYLVLTCNVWDLFRLAWPLELIWPRPNMWCPFQRTTICQECNFPFQRTTICQECNFPSKWILLNERSTARNCKCPVVAFNVDWLSSILCTSYSRPYTQHNNWCLVWKLCENRRILRKWARPS